MRTVHVGVGYLRQPHVFIVSLPGAHCHTVPPPSPLKFSFFFYGYCGAVLLPSQLLNFEFFSRGFPPYWVLLWFFPLVDVGHVLLN